MRAGIDPNSNEGVMFAQALTLNRISLLSARLNLLEKNDRGRTGGSGHDATAEVAQLPKMPLLDSRTELEALKELDQRAVDWLDTIGGNTPKDFVHRALNGLLSHTMQTQINRTGGFNKLKFPAAIEIPVSEKCRKLFPSETIASVEKLIIRFFKNSSDRAGGRKQRMSCVRVPLERPDRARRQKTVIISNNSDSEDEACVPSSDDSLSL